MNARGALRSALLALLGLGASGCGAAYAVPPEQAAQRNDDDWTIKHQPAPPAPPAPTVAEVAPDAEEPSVPPP
ncbi:MAG TPA: hypothetical protein VEQ59_15720 [Polyangiaceae bacterium]|nr:hypothetical protein [Polyangiaceae bacterium]